MAEASSDPIALAAEADDAAVLVSVHPDLRHSVEPILPSLLADPPLGPRTLTSAARRAERRRQQEPYPRVYRT